MPALEKVPFIKADSVFPPWVVLGWGEWVGFCSDTLRSLPVACLQVLTIYEL